MESRWVRPVAEAWHQSRRQSLTRADLQRLARGELPVDIVRYLCACQIGKNQLLFEAIRRAVRDMPDHDGMSVIDSAARTLVNVQTWRPDIAAEFLALPHFGSWAKECLFALRGHIAAPAKTLLPTPAHLGYVATVAAAAAIRAGHPFELTVPVSDGGITLPTLGRVRLDTNGWARIRQTGQGTFVLSGCRVIPIAQGLDQRAGADDRWSPAVRVRAQTDQLAIDIGIETLDPLVRRYGSSVAHLSTGERAHWQRRLAKAWRILVTHHRQTAEALAAGLTTLVPLAEPYPGHPVSATSGWAWGAIALSLPADPLWLAETLVHEFHHLILSAAEDLVELVVDVDAERYYAPWRDDPRPLPELLQGCYAHFGVAGFWLRQGQRDSAGLQQRCAVEFARRSQVTLEIAQELANSAALSPAGRDIASSMRDRLAEWQLEPVSDRARLIASELTTEHRVRWRVTHLRPGETMIKQLARSWLDSTVIPPDPADLPVAVVDTSRLLSATRSRLLELRYRDQSRFKRALRTETTLTAADLAFLSGDDRAASVGYLQRIEATGDLDAWVGFILLRHRTATTVIGLPLRRPEIIVALHQWLHAMTGIATDPDALIAWLSRWLQGTAEPTFNASVRSS